MKKITFILLAGLTLLGTSCNKTYNDTDTPAGGPATFSIAPTCATEYEKLPKNGSQIVTFAAVTEDTGVRNQLTATFSMGGSELVAAYNAMHPEINAQEFPAGACSFVKNGVAVDRYNKSSRSASISVSNTSDMLKDTYYVLPVLLDSVEGADNVSTNTDEVVYFLFFALGLDKGQGTKDKPYLIYEPDDFVNMISQAKGLESSTWASVEAAKAAVPTYFKMMEDIDMSGIDWEPVNYNDDYRKKVDFNGNGKTISNLTCSVNKTSNFNYFSIFGVLWGDAYDFTVTNATIEGNCAIGVVCGYAGTGNKRGNIKHVTVKNSSVTGTGSNAKGAAIIAGRLVGGEVGACAAINCTVEVNCNFPGGIVGYTNADGSYIHDCLFNGKVKGAQRIGGIVGMTAKNYDKVINCIALGELEGQRCLGGIGGHANYDKWDERHPANEYIGCIAWNNLTVTEVTEDGPTSSGIIGFTSIYNTGSNCWRNPNMKLNLPNGGFAEGEYNPGGKFNTLFDQNDFSESSPLPDTFADPSAKLYRAPYHGKAATVSASALAKKIGWDETIWDLSGEIPALK